MKTALLVHVLRHEIRLLTRARASWTVLVVLALLCLVAALNGSRWTAEQRRTILRIADDDRRAYDAIYAQLSDLERRGDPRPPLQLAGMAWYLFQFDGAIAPAPHIDPRRAEAGASEWLGARHAVLPPAPFAALAIGQSDLHPYYTRVTIRTRPILVQSDEIENPVNLLSGRLDIAFVLLVCWPLLALPLLYNVRSDERERGTLALIAAQPVSIGSLLATRLAVRGVVLVAVTAAATLGALAGVGGLADVPLSSIGALIIIVCANATMWCGVAAAINLTRWRSATNATAFVACWLAAVVVAPALIAEAAAFVAPVPSRIELINAVRAAGSLDASQLTQLVNAYYEQHPDATPTRDAADVTAIRGLAQQDAVDARIAPILSAYRRAVTTQQAVTDRMRFMSPPLLVFDAVTELAETNNTRYHHFAEQVDHFHQAWRGYFYPLVHARATMTRAKYENAPRFQFHEEPHEHSRWRALRLTLLPLLTGSFLVTVSARRSRSGAGL